MKELPQYQSHKKVWALKIKEMSSDESGLWITPEEEGYAPFIVPSKFVPNHAAARPQIGWYWVRYSNDYESFSPADAFEDGYTHIVSAK